MERALLRPGGEPGEGPGGPPHPLGGAGPPGGPGPTAPLLIQNGVRVEAEAVAGTVYTDEKWAAFLLGQLLQNAARYRRDRPVITLTAQPLGTGWPLTVADNGLGIPCPGAAPDL